MKSVKSKKAKLREPAIYKIEGCKDGYVLWQDVCQVLDHPGLWASDVLGTAIDVLNKKPLELRHIDDTSQIWIYNAGTQCFHRLGTHLNFKRRYFHTCAGVLVPAGFAKLVRQNFAKMIAPLLTIPMGEQWYG